jgi:uncharacterized protein DUF5906
VSERFGLSSLYDASAWIRDDAINEGDDLDPQRFKTIVTGEPIDIERKHRDAVRGVELAIPGVLTANALPRARDKSDALFNRSLVLELTNVLTEEDAIAFRTELGVPRGQNLASFVFGLEGPGILNWALDGLERLLERGAYEVPDNVSAAVQRFKDDARPSYSAGPRRSPVRTSSAPSTAGSANRMGTKPARLEGEASFNAYGLRCPGWRTSRIPLAAATSAASRSPTKGFSSGSCTMLAPS